MTTWDMALACASIVLQPGSLDDPDKMKPYHDQYDDLVNCVGPDEAQKLVDEAGRELGQFFGKAGHA